MQALSTTRSGRARPALRRRALLAAATAALLTAPAAWAQGFPSRPINILVGFAPGGPTDAAARVVAERMAAILKVPVTVENRPGANATIAVRAVMAAPPDGYTLMFGSSGTQALAPATQKKLFYNPSTDFTPVAFLVKFHSVLVVHPSLPVNNVNELVAYAKKNPGKLSYGSSGIGAAAHMKMEYLKHITGIDLVHVPYKGDAAMTSDLLAGRIHIGLNTTGVALPQIKAGKVRALGSTSLKRLPLAPEIPTLVESGIPGIEDLDPSTWGGLVGPARMPADVVAKLHAAVNQALQSPELLAHFRRLGFEAAPGTPEEFRRFADAEIVRWRDLAKRAHIEVE